MDVIVRKRKNSHGAMRPRKKKKKKKNKNQKTMFWAGNDVSALSVGHFLRMGHESVRYK